MAKLPHAQRAIIEISKLRNYCLNPEHPRGRHKAQVFRHALGIDRPDAEHLRDMILDGIQTANAMLLDSDKFGQRWRVDLEISGPKKLAVVRTVWIIHPGADAPRFVTCWVV